MGAPNDTIRTGLKMLPSRENRLSHISIGSRGVRKPTRGKMVVCLGRGTAQPSSVIVEVVNGWSR